MNVTRMETSRAGTPSSRRAGLLLALGLAVAGTGLLVHAAFAEARLELVLVALGLAAAAALVGLLVVTPSGLVVRRDD